MTGVEANNNFKIQNKLPGINVQKPNTSVNKPAGQQKALVTVNTNVQAQSNVDIVPKKYEIRTTRDGTKAITITRANGTIKDISTRRVKQFTQPEPRNPTGKPSRVNFKKSGSPAGTKPFATDPKKRTLNKNERKLINKVNKI